MFTLNPTFEKVDYTTQDKKTIIYLINKSWYTNNCSITWPLWMKQWTIVLWLTCVDKTWVYNARMWIDYNNKIYVRTR